MTLTSMVAIGGGAIDVRKVYELCRPIVQTPDAAEPMTTAAWRPGRQRLSNPIGIGALACLDVEYSPDGPCSHVCDDRCLINHKVCERGDPDDDPDENGWSAAIVYLDTAYGYRGPGGDRCGDVHAYLIREIGRALDGWGRPWQWFDYDHCEWHTRFDGLHILGDPELTEAA